MRDKSRTTIAVMMSLLMFFATAADVMGFTINTGNYQEMSTYPGIRTFDYSKTPIRENIDAESMVEPEYTFRVEDRTIDEFFGTVGTYTNGSVSYRGCYLNKNTKGQCGVRYNRLFRYQDEWIDVKTTYMDWSVVDKNKAFVNGGTNFSNPARTSRSLSRGSSRIPMWITIRESDSFRKKCGISGRTGTDPS